LILRLNYHIDVNHTEVDCENNREAMELSRPDVTWANVKNDISRMQKCLVESLKTCDQLEQVCIMFSF